MDYDKASAFNMKPYLLFIKSDFKWKLFSLSYQKSRDMKLQNPKHSISNLQQRNYLANSSIHWIIV